MKYLNDISYKDCVGKVCKSNLSGYFKILKYNNSENVEIQFTNTGYRKVAVMKEVRNGKVKDHFSPSVYGVGILGTKYPPSMSGRNTKEYNLWRNMLQRCYSDTFQKKQPTYEGCEVSNNFKYFEYFYEWCHKQIGFNNEGWQLDKDLLIKGNKVYSESTCVFLPQEINNILTKSASSRGEHLIGVSWCKTNKAFKAQVSRSKGKSEYLGLFKTETEAFNAYKQAKESFVKEQAEKWKGKINERAYNTLMNYKVDIDD